MRRVTLWAPQGERDRLLEAAGRHGALDSLASVAEAEGRTVDVVVTLVPTGAVDDLVAELTGEVDELHVSFLPHGALALRPPPGEPPDKVLEVDDRSPLEIVLSSRQSVGSWPTFLTYAAISGAVVFAAFATNTIYLLVGAMLISPLAEPVMNSAVALARGTAGQLARGVARYLAALSAGAAVAAALAVVYGLDAPTSLMSDVSSVSLTAVLLPLSAGVAGAVNLVSSERSSLVSGAGPGLLIAASLAPPMGLVGIGAVQGEGGLLGAAAFLLALQLAGIVIAAALVFRLAGVRAEGLRFARGRPAVARGGAVAAALALAALVALQSFGTPELRRESLARDAEAAARGAVTAGGLADPVTIGARLPRDGVPGRRTVLITGVLLRAPDATGSPAELEPRVADAVARAVRGALPEVTPVVDLTVAVP